MKRFVLIIFSISAFFLASCSNNGNNGEKTEDTAGDSLVFDSLKNEMSEFYSMPGPLQIPTAIRAENPKFYEDLLNPTKNSPAVYSNNFKKAINLGIFAIDLGYASSYNQGQTSVNYLVTAAKLANELNVGGAIHPNLVDRYKKNLNNKDSINFLIIKTFNDINGSLSNSNRQYEAMLILTGSFIEGVHLSTALYKKEKTKSIGLLIGEQKIFLDNLLKILPGYDDKEEVKELLVKLEDLKSEYDKLEIKTSDEGGNIAKITDIVITDENIMAITGKIIAIRSTMLN